MLINVNNLGLAEPRIQLASKYLNASASAAYDSEGKFYALQTGAVTLLKLDITDFDTNLLVSNAKLKIKIKEAVSETTFKLYEVDSADYLKTKASEVTFNTLLDVVDYNMESSDDADEANIIEFDLSKYFYNKITSETTTVYLAITCDLTNYKLLSIEDLKDNEVILSMQLNSLKGLDPLYEYDQEEVGFAGVSTINLANGKMIHKVEAIQTPGDENPAVFHMFFNKDQATRINILGQNWTYSGDYGCEVDYEDGMIKLVDPSQKTSLLQKCDGETIKEAYGFDELIDDIEDPDLYICLSEPMYALVNKSDTKNCIFVDKSGNKMIFENKSDYSRIAKIELSNGKYIDYIYDDLANPTQIINSDGDFLSIEYNLSKVSKVSVYKRNGMKLGSILISYENDRISNIKSYFGIDTTFINEATFTYDDFNRLDEVSDVTGGVGSKFQYSSSNQVVKVHHIFLGDTNTQQFTDYDYFTFQTRVTDYTGFYSDYYFDYFGRCKNIVDCEAKSITRNYDEVVDGNPGNLNSESKLQINERNVIDNYSFDSADGLFDNSSSWQLISGDLSNIKVVDGGVYGQRCLRIEKNTSETIKLQQVLKNVEEGTYTFKCFLKSLTGVDSTMSAGSLKVNLIVNYKEKILALPDNGNLSGVPQIRIEEKEEVYELSNITNQTFDWTEFERTSVTIPGGSRISDLNVSVIIELTGANYTAYIDDLSLIYGDHKVRHNFVNNGYFENGTNGWLFTNTTSSDGVVSIGTSTGHHKVLGENVLKLTSNLDNIKTVFRTINMHGGSGDELLLNMFGKGNVTTNEIFRGFIKIHYIDTDTLDRFEFKFDPNFEYWQVLTRKIIAQRAYDYVEIGVEVKSKSTVYVDAIQLYKDSFGKEYSYNEKKNMTEMVNADGSCANISYDEKSNVTEATDESGDTYRYVYNNDKKVTQISNNQNTRVLFTYDENCGKKKETKLVSNKGDILKTNQTYDVLGRTISQTDDYGVQTTFAYDGYDRQVSETAANGLVTTFKYDANNMLEEQLSKLGTDQSKCNYTYDSKGNIKTITCDNGTVYEFEYANNQQVSSIKVDGQAFVKNSYTKLINGVNTNLLTKQTLGENDENGYYSFNYDEKQRLTHIYYNEILQVLYEYDEHNRVSKLTDHCNNSVEFFTYDGKGQLISVTNANGNSIVYDYDNLSNIQKTTLNIDGVLRSFDYEYKCEYNDYTSSGYLQRLQRAFPDEIIKGGSGVRGVYGAKPRTKNIKGDTINVGDSTPLSDNVASLSFKDKNAVLVYPFETMNKERKAESTTDKTFTYEKWNNQFKTRKTVYAWIKPTAYPSEEQRIFGLSKYPSTGFRFILTVNVDKTITFKDLNSELSDGNCFQMVSQAKLEVDKWNLVGFKIDYNSEAETKTVTMVLNDEIQNSTYSDGRSMDSLKYFVVGYEEPPIVNWTEDGNTSNEDTTNNMPFRLAFASAGSTNIENQDFLGIYTQGQKYLLSEPNYGASGVTFFDECVYKGFDVITLNGSLTSLQRMKPKVHSYTEDSFKVEKSRMFKFDNTGNNPLHRHVYASYNDGINLNRGNYSKLAYDLLLRNSGTITIRFKLDNLSHAYNERMILSFGDCINQKLKLYVDSHNTLTLENSDGERTPIAQVTSDEWHFISLRFNGENMVVNYDELVYNTCVSNFDLDNTLTYIGCSVDINEKPINHLNGCLEMLAFKDAYATDSQIDNIKNNGQSFSIRTYYDELGRTSAKKIHSKDNTLSKKLTYAKKNELTSTKVEMEDSYNGLDSISYGYDAVGNLNRVEIDSDGLITDKFYEYDGLSRLKKSTINGVTNTYVYDSNNNIKFKNNIEYKYEGTFKDQLTSRSDGTIITYDASGFIGNPSTISKPNQNLQFIWNGRRLASVRDTITRQVLNFKYNASGLRTEKEVEDEYREKYFLDGNKIATLKRITEESEKIVNFVYDEAQELVGFTYNGKQYFYDRLVTGEIRHIIDETGKIYVSYEYDDWGMPSIYEVDNLIGSELSKLNPFMYKGYFYDFEIKMYYLKSRYYDPDLGRFINADAEIGSVGETMGMNLYAYCKCNPICYSDENGNWPKWATKICIGLAVIAVCAIVAVVCVATGGAAACVATSMAVGAINGALIGAVQGAVTGAIIGAITEGIKTGTWEGALKGAIKGAIEGAADGFMWGAIGGAISGAMNPKFCFVAGTLVMTKQGLKAIEEIKVGEQVLSYNDNLEIFEYKDVIDVYTNETTELCHIHTEAEEVVCTPNHSILTTDGWKLASELTNNDVIKTSTGYVRVLSIFTEQLKEKLVVYNFNVLGYHTYLVGNELLVVHNKCVKMDNKKFVKDNRMDSKEFHKFKEDIIKNSNLPKKFGNNPDIYYDNKTLEIFLRSRNNKTLELFKTGLSLIGFIV